MMIACRKPYPSDVSDEEWSLVAPYLCLLCEDASQREHALREMFNGLRTVVKTGAPWRWMPNDLPPWAAVRQQARRWLAAGCFEALASDLRAVLRLAAGRAEEPTAAILDSRTLRSTPEGGARAGWDGYKRTEGSKLHLAVGTLGHLLALRVTPANTDGRAAVAALADAVQDATGQSVELAYVDQGCTGKRAAEAAQEQGIQLGSGQAARSQARLRAAAAALGGTAQGSARDGAWKGSGGGRAQLRLDVAPAGSHAATSACPRCWQACTSPPSSCSCSGKQQTSSQSITASRGEDAVNLPWSFNSAPHVGAAPLPE